MSNENDDQALYINDFNEPESEYLENLSNQELAKYLVKHALPEEMLECLKSQNDIYNTEEGKRQLLELEKFIRKEKPNTQEDIEMEIEDVIVPQLRRTRLSSSDRSLEDRMENLTLDAPSRKKRRSRKRTRRQRRRSAKRKRRRTVRRSRRNRRTSRKKSMVEGTMQDVFNTMDSIGIERIKQMKGRELKKEISERLKAKGMKKKFVLSDIKAHLKSMNSFGRHKRRSRRGFGNTLLSKGDMVVRSRDVYGLQPIRYDTKDSWTYPNTNFVKRSW